MATGANNLGFHTRGGHMGEKMNWVPDLWPISQPSRLLWKLGYKHDYEWMTGVGCLSNAV